MANIASNFFKNQFRHLNFYSLPNSILFVLRKRLNLVFLVLFFFITLLVSVI